MKITAHCLVKNEENFIWYAVNSVINHVDKILLWDTGSSDSTVEIIKEISKIYKNKIDFKQIGETSKQKYSDIRQKMIDVTNSEWIMILDGDEIWWNNSISKVISAMNDSTIESIVTPTINPIGDIYHYQENSAGRYKLAGKIGHLNLRFFKKNIPGIHVVNDYGKEGFADDKNNLIQERGENKVIFIDAAYIHTTYLSRSSQDKLVMQRQQKLKHEIGISFPNDFYYPEVFFESRPNIVTNVWKKMDFLFYLQSVIETPLKIIKRKII